MPDQLIRGLWEAADIGAIATESLPEGSIYTLPHGEYRFPILTAPSTIASSLSISRQPMLYYTEKTLKSFAADTTGGFKEYPKAERLLRKPRCVIISDDLMVDGLTDAFVERYGSSRLDLIPIGAPILSRYNSDNYTGTGEVPLVPPVPVESNSPFAILNMIVPVRSWSFTDGYFKMTDDVNGGAPVVKGGSTYLATMSEAENHIIGGEVLIIGSVNQHDAYATVLHSPGVVVNTYVEGLFFDNRGFDIDPTGYFWYDIPGSITLENDGLTTRYALFTNPVWFDSDMANANAIASKCDRFSVVMVNNLSKPGLEYGTPTADSYSWVSGLLDAAFAGILHSPFGGDDPSPTYNQDMIAFVMEQIAAFFPDL